MREFIRSKFVGNIVITGAVLVAGAVFVFECTEARMVHLPRAEVGEIRVSEEKYDGTVDVTVEVVSMAEDFAIDASASPNVKRLSSGVYDLRLFRNGQLVGTSTPRQAIERYIKAAPSAVERDRTSGAILNTEEDKLWREANDMAKVVRFDAAGKAIYTFRGIRLPRDGSTEVEFSAYAFNSDRVKSDTVRTNYSVEKPEKRSGRAYIISIGVNAYENSSFDLQYAANDARKMLKEVGTRLWDGGKAFSEVVTVPLISERRTADHPAVNTARKEIIKGVFSMLAGRATEVSAVTRRQIPNVDKIKPIEAEDTLIVTFAGHGYADRSGIFYLLPSDIGAGTVAVSNENVGRMISSDELSLWMLDITAAEMIMVIDACYSSSAVQGEGFKPGPMGSRGLGQLAYDKGIRILSATQANNVALELGSLKQGLLSYVLLEEGIVKGLADTGTPADGKLTVAEWLGYAVEGVPKLYDDVLAGRRSVIVGKRSVDTSKLSVTERAKLFCKDKCDRKSIVQQPSVFDFRRKKTERPIIALEEKQLISNR